MLKNRLKLLVDKIRTAERNSDYTTLSRLEDGIRNLLEESEGRKPLQYDKRILWCAVSWSPVFPPGKHVRLTKAIAIATMHGARHPICADHVEYLHDHLCDTDWSLDKVRECDLIASITNDPKVHA